MAWKIECDFLKTLRIKTVVLHTCWTVFLPVDKCHILHVQLICCALIKSLSYVMQADNHLNMVCFPIISSELHRLFKETSLEIIFEIILEMMDLYSKKYRKKKNRNTVHTVCKMSRYVCMYGNSVQVFDLSCHFMWCVECLI